MKRINLLVGILFLMKFAAAQDLVNVTQFGAVGDGVTDNKEAFTEAFQYCVDNHKVCYIPKESNSYIVTGTVHIALSQGQSLTITSNGATISAKGSPSFESYLLWKLTPSFQEIALWSFGNRAATSNISTSFAQDNNSSLSISGLLFKGFSNGFEAGQKLLSALDISTDKVSLSNLTFENIKGYGLRSFGAKQISIENVKMNQVGGRGEVPANDAYGDGIYIAVLKNNATVSIKNCNLTGAVINQRRSRSGITFEFSNQAYQAIIDHCIIAGFAKCVHFEDKATETLVISDCHFSKFNYAVAMVANQHSILNVDQTFFDFSGTDGVDRGDGGPVVNTNHGGTINFYQSTLNLNGKKHAYISMVGVNLLKNCTINGNNKNPFFADGQVTFDSCSFVDFGGPLYSFYAYGKSISMFKIVDSKFKGGGAVNATGQRVNLIVTRTVSTMPLRNQTFQQ